MGRILVIEDEVGTQVLLKGRLHDLGHDVVMASTGAMGLMEARAQPFDLFIVDIHLGSGIDGHEVCRRIKAVPQMRSIPVVLLSGKVDSREELHRGYEAGCEAYVLKGDTNLLEDVVRVMLRIKSLQDELALQNKLLERRNRAREEEERNGELEAAIRGDDVRASVLQELARGRPDGVLVVDAEGIVRFADRGARDLLGRDLEGRHLGSLTPSSGLEAYVRDAVNDPREGYTVDLTLKQGSVERSLSAAVVPLAPRPGDAAAPLRIVLLFDAAKQRLARELLQLPPAELPRQELGVLLEGARREYRPARYVGASAASAEVRMQLEREAKTKNPVWIVGESGSGRGLAARILHFGGFHSGAFVPVDCTALAPENARAELFGRAAGSGAARADRPGALLLAHLGTLMLLEPEALPGDVQEELAKAVQDGRVQREGSKKRERAEVRLVCVSTEPMADELAPALRSLLVSRIDCPPLARRPDDIVPLAKHLLANHSVAGRVCEMAEDALWVFEQYAWPGNVRELKTTIERAVEKASGPFLRGADLPRPLADLFRRYEERDQLPIAPRAAPPSNGAVTNRRGRLVPPPPAPIESEPVSLEIYEKHCLQRALRETGGDKLAAARLLKVGKSTLYRKLKRYGIA